MLGLDRLAGPRGDGLLPEIRELLEFRARSAAGDPAVRMLPGAERQAGPNPAGGSGMTAPNVVVLERYRRAVAGKR
jgi:hypothetical protein